MDGLSRIYVALQPPGGLLLTFDTSGRFLGHVGSTGRGPGEFVFPVSAVPGTDCQILVWEIVRAMLTTLDSAHRFVTGVHQPYSPVAVLPNVPTLVICARHDTMDPAHMDGMAGTVQKGRYLYCPDGSHLAMYDDQKVYVDGVIRFLQDVDAERF